jgi:hypothetical protein
MDGYDTPIFGIEETIGGGDLQEKMGKKKEGREEGKE